MLRMVRREHLRVGDADDGAVRVPEVVELRLAERDADRLEVARRRCGYPTCPAYAPMRSTQPAANWALYLCRVSSSATVFGIGAHARAQVEERVVDAVDRARRAGAARIEAHDVEAGLDHRREAAPGEAEVVDARLAGSAVVDHQRADALGRRRRRVAQRGRCPPCSRRRLRLPVDGDAQRAALEAVAAVGPRRPRRRTPGARGHVVVVVVVDGFGFGLRAPASPFRHGAAGTSAPSQRERPGTRGGVASWPGGFAPRVGEAELARVEDPVGVERGLRRREHVERVAERGARRSDRG